MKIVFIAVLSAALALMTARADYYRVVGSAEVEFCALDVDGETGHVYLQWFTRPGVTSSVQRAASPSGPWLIVPGYSNVVAAGTLCTVRVEP